MVVVVEEVDELEEEELEEEELEEEELDELEVVLVGGGVPVMTSPTVRTTVSGRVANQSRNAE